MPRWTTSPRAHYDDLVDRVLPPSARHVRPTSSTIRGALVAGFAVVFAIWLLSGYEIVRRLQDVEVRATEAHESFVRGERTLSTIRTSVLLGSIYLRDALIDTGAVTREFYRDELNQIRGDIERLVPAYVLDVQLPIERQHWAELQAQLDDYWASLDVVLDPNSPQTTGQAAALLRQRVVPRRDTILAIVDRLAALQRLSQQQYQIETSLLYAEARTRLLSIAGLALLVGIVVAFFATRHVARLHREIERQRLAERQTRHDLRAPVRPPRQRTGRGAAEPRARAARRRRPGADRDQDGSRRCAAWPRFRTPARVARGSAIDRRDDAAERARPVATAPPVDARRLRAAGGGHRVSAQLLAADRHPRAAHDRADGGTPAVGGRGLRLPHRAGGDDERRPPQRRDGVHRRARSPRRAAAAHHRGRRKRD